VLASIDLDELSRGVVDVDQVTIALRGEMDTSPVIDRPGALVDEVVLYFVLN